MKQPLHRVVRVATLVLVSAFTAFAGAALSNVENAQVAFTASGPAGLKIEGTTPDLSIKEGGASILFTVPLARLTTGIGLRDKHMKEYLEVEKYPTAELTIDRTALKLPSGNEKTTGDVPGTLRLHGATEPVQLHYSIKRDGKSLNVDGNAQFNITEVGMKVPSYLGVSVKPQVEISAHFRIADQ